MGQQELQMEQHITAGGNQKLVSPSLRRITGWALLAGFSSQPINDLQTSFPQRG